MFYQTSAGVSLHYTVHVCHGAFVKNLVENENTVRPVAAALQ